MSLLDDIAEDWSNFKKAVVHDVEDVTGITVKLANSMTNAAAALLNFDDSNTRVLTGLDAQIKHNETLTSKYLELTQASLVLEKRNAQINKSFGVGVKQAALLSQEFQKVATTLGISGEQTAKYGGSIKKMLPTLNQINESSSEFYTGMQQTQHILQTNIGLTEDQSNAYTQFAASSGESAATMLQATKALSDSLDPGGTMGYFKMITEEISGLSENLQMQYGKIPGNLALAVIKAKKLGFTLEDLAGTADNLLDIESSIGQELEYQLLSGRRLTDTQGNSLTNMYREAALRGDMNKQADIMNNILETEGETIENNMFARKQLAATLGIEERQLASALQKKKILDKAAASGIEIDLEGSNALEAAADAVKAGALSPEDFEALKDASDTRTTDDIVKQQLLVQEEQLTLQKTLLNQVTLITGNQKAIKDNAKDLGKSYLGLSKNEMEFLGKKQMAQTTITAGKEGGEEAWNNMLAGKGGGSRYTTATTNTQEKINTNNDAVIPAGYGSRILSFPEDTLQAPIAFNNDDTIVAGTNLTGKGTSNGPDMAQFAAMIVAAINNQTRALKSDPTFSGGINAPYYG